MLKSVVGTNDIPHHFCCNHWSLTESLGNMGATERLHGRYVCSVMLDSLGLSRLLKPTGRVETLSGSDTLIGAILTQVQLRNINLLAVALVVLWSLSPLGGQASLRIARPGTRVITSQREVSFLDPSSTYTMGQSGDTDLKPLAKTMFATSLVSSQLLYGKPQDNWGNPRVPIVEVFDNYQDHEWIEIGANATNTTFSSLVGIPFSPGLPNDATSFTLNTSYMSLNCPTMKKIPKVNGTLFTNFTANLPPFHILGGWYMSSPHPACDPSLVAPGGFQIAMSACLRGCRPLLNESQVPQPREARRVIWESAGKESLSHIECTLHTTYVDVNYTCVNSSCIPEAVRLSPTGPGPEHFSDPGFPDNYPNDPWNLHNFTGLDRGSSFSPVGFLSSITEAFDFSTSHDTIPILSLLLSPNNSFARPVHEETFYRDILDLGRATFETRFAQLLNTQYIIGGYPEMVAKSFSVSPQNRSTKYDGAIVANRTATTQHPHPILVCKKPWFFTMLVASIILLLASVMGAVLRALTLVPDVLGTLSIVTLDNRVERPLQKASMLDGLDRSRLLKNVKIKLGNVEAGAPSGRIAFAAPAGHNDMVNLDEGSFYE